MRWIYRYSYGKQKKRKTAITKPPMKKITFNKSLLSFKEQTDWPWKAFVERRESFNVSSKSSEKLLTANSIPRKQPFKYDIHYIFLQNLRMKNQLLMK